VLQRVFEETKKNEKAFLDYDERINSLILMATKPTLVHVQRYLEKHDLRQPVKMTSPVIHHRGGVISVVAKDMDLADLFRQIGAAVTQTIEVSEHIDERVSIELWQVNWRVALNRIAQQTQCNVNEFPGGVFGITQPALINVEANEEDVRDVVQKIAKQAGVSIILHPEFKATLTLDLRMVHWLRALHAIIKTVGEFELIEETDDLLRVVPSSSIEVQLETTVFKLKGSGVSTSGLKRFVTRTFQRLGEPEGATIDFVADANSGSGQVVLVASKPGAYQIKRLLKKLGALAEDR
jgi:type II secretory pathway component GspD/PulD (secretin)